MFPTPPTHIPVLIVGGGIVGLSASLFLSHQGIHTLLVERHSGTSIHPRARSVNARTMELYRGIGISDAVREAGASLAPSMGIYSGTTLKEVIESKPRSEKVRKFPLAGLSESTGPERGQFVTQDMIEPVLLKAAKERGVDARFYTECVGVDQDEEKATATLRDRGNGSTYSVTADYCIAADGANSPIRSQLGISRTGQGSLGNLLNILFHADLQSLVKNREFSLCKIEQPTVSGLFTSINNSDRWVFHLLFDPLKGEKPEDFPPKRCAELLRLALGIPEIDIEIKSILPWQASVRVAENVQVGRIFLAGDAAHQMPPYAGQGANSGIADVHNLSWKLAAVLKHHASPSLLETYETERLPVGKTAAEVSGSSTDEKGLISMKWDFETAMGWARKLPLMSGFGYFYSGKGVMEESTWPLGGWSWRPWTIPSLFLGMDGRPGTRAPHVRVEKEGVRISTIDMFGKGFVLLTGSSGASWVEAAGKVAEKLKGMELTAYVVGSKGDVVDSMKGFETAAGISSTGALLVRPDGFVAWRERRIPADCEKMLEEVMRQSLCLR